MVRSIFSLSGKGEAERGAAFAAIGPLRDRRGGVPVGLALPGDVGLLHVLEGDRDAAGGALAHPAVAQIGLVILDPRRVADPPAGAAASSPRQSSPPPVAAVRSVLRDRACAGLWRPRPPLLRYRVGRRGFPCWQALDSASAASGDAIGRRTAERAASCLDDRCSRPQQLEPPLARIPRRCDKPEARWTAHTGE